MPKSRLIWDNDDKLNLERISVLLVDDNAFIRRLVLGVLRSFGVQSLTEVSDAAEAFKLLKRHHYDLIICDYLMEPLNGIDFVRLVRTASDSKDPEVPIIMLTGHTEYENIIQARDAGVTELLAKPISARALLHRLIYIFDHPRPFIRAKHYTGPDRRRQFVEWHGEDRRNLGPKSHERETVSPEGIEIDPRWGLSASEIKQIVKAEDRPDAQSSGAAAS